MGLSEVKLAVIPEGGECMVNVASRHYKIVQTSNSNTEYRIMLRFLYWEYAESNM